MGSSKGRDFGGTFSKDSWICLSCCIWFSDLKVSAVHLLLALKNYNCYSKLTWVHLSFKKKKHMLWECSSLKLSVLAQFCYLLNELVYTIPTPPVLQWSEHGLRHYTDLTALCLSAGQDKVCHVFFQCSKLFVCKIRVRLFNEVVRIKCIRDWKVVNTMPAPQGADVPQLQVLSWHSRGLWLCQDLSEVQDQCSCHFQ